MCACVCVCVSECVRVCNSGLRNRHLYNKVIYKNKTIQTSIHHWERTSSGLRKYIYLSPVCVHLCETTALHHAGDDSLFALAMKQ